MIKCPKCGNEISDKSTNCIYCGLTRNMIDQELQIKKLSLNREFNINVGKNKTLVIIIEIFIIIILVAFYATVYVPKILEYTRQERTKNNIATCEEKYNGTWNYETDECQIEFGSIDID